MILIADGGSTKCDWVLLDDSCEKVLKTRTKGLNPAVVEPDELESRIRENTELVGLFKTVKKVDFYGAGCGAAAVYAATDKPGIVCILGTGSNSCYFDGKDIHMEVDSLGYALMDEASGNYFGKRLIRDYFYKKMPDKLAKEFEKRFDLNTDVIKLNVYKRPNPNTYLASFAEFIFTSEEVNGYFYKLISEGMFKFIENKILCYKEAQHVPIHFIGSIAHFSEDIIRDCMKPYHLELGNIIRRPIDGLIDYYKRNEGCK